MTSRKNLSLAMALRTLVAGLVLVGITAFVTSRVVSEPPKAPEMSKEMMDMQKHMMEAGMVGPQHKGLEALVGEWNAEAKFWMPGVPDAQTSTATAKNTWIMGGRFVQQEYMGKMEGQDFIGNGIWGYDNLQKKYNSGWIDNMSTAIYTSLGTADASGKKITFEGEGPCCMTGKIVKMKSVLTIVSNDKHVYEMWGPNPADGKMTKGMEITYTRKTTKSASAN